MFPVIPLSINITQQQMEELGSKPKFWFTFQGQKTRHLFKTDDRGTGEDWAEKVSCELCGLLGIPHVHYDMAFQVQTSRLGVICENCAPSPDILVLGNQLLLALDSDYPVDRPRYKADKHTVEAVVSVLGSIEPPSDQWSTNIPQGIESALDVFIGYVMLDAWIANQDRHHENWGGIFQSGKIHLAPTFDHGAALARNIKDGERIKRMATRDAGYGVAAYARKAKSAFYSAASPNQTLTTHEAWRSFAKHAPHAASIWLERLRGIDGDAVQKVLLQISPERLTDTGREFTARLLWENRSLLLEGV